LMGGKCERLEEAVERFNDSMAGSYYAELVSCGDGRAVVALYEEECPSCSLDEAIVELVKSLEEEGVNAEVEEERESMGGEKLLTLTLKRRGME